MITTGDFPDFLFTASEPADCLDDLGAELRIRTPSPTRHSPTVKVVPFETAREMEPGFTANEMALARPNANPHPGRATL